MKWLARRSRRKSSSLASRAGFSLMEVLVALGILALIGVLVIASFSAANYGRQVYDRNESRFHEARVVLQRMARDISSAFLSKHESPDKNTHTLFKGDTEKLDFTYLGHRVFTKGKRTSDRGKVGYSLQSDSSGSCLMRRSQGVIDDRPDEGGRTEKLVCGVKKLELKFWDDDKEEWASDWDTDNKEYDGKLPTRVKILLILAGEGDKELRFETQAAIGLTAAIKF